MNTSKFLRELSIRTIAQRFDPFKAQESIQTLIRKLHDSCSMDDTNKELKRASQLQNQLYALQCSLSETDAKTLYLACYFSLSKLSELYPARNEKCVYKKRLVHEVPQSQLVKLSSGHHEHVQWFIDALTTTENTEIRADHGKNYDTVLVYRQPLNNPHTAIVCTARDMIAVLATAQKKDLAIPEELIALHDNEEEHEHIFIGSHTARKKLRQSPFYKNRTQLDCSLTVNVLHLEDVEYYHYLLNTDPDLTLQDLLSWGPEKLRSQYHKQQQIIESLTQSFIQEQALQPDEINKLDILSLHYLHTPALIESSTLQILYKAYQQQIHTEETSDIKYLTDQVYKTIYYNDYQNNNFSSPSNTELEAIDAATVACFEQTIFTKHSLSFQDVFDFLHSNAFHELKKRLLFTLQAHHHIEDKHFYTIAIQPNSLLADCVELRQNKTIKALLKKCGKTHRDIIVDCADIHHSIQTIMEYFSSSLLQELVEKKIVPFELIANLTEKHYQRLISITDGFKHCDKVIKTFLKEQDCATLTKFLKVFFADEKNSTSSILQKLAFIDPIKNLHSQPVRNKVYNRKLPIKFESAICLTDEARENIESLQTSDSSDEKENTVKSASKHSRAFGQNSTPVIEIRTPSIPNCRTSNARVIERRPKDIDPPITSKSYTQSFFQNPVCRSTTRSTQTRHSKETAYRTITTAGPGRY